MSFNLNWLQLIPISLYNKDSSTYFCAVNIKNNPIQARLITYCCRLLFVIIGFTFSACTKPLPSEEGRKHLKAFDNEMVQLANRISKTEGFKAFISLSQLPDPPTPFMSKNIESAYDFNASKGLYHLNSEADSFEKITKSDVVELVYPFDSRFDSLASFVLSEYSESSTALDMAFPEKLEASIRAGNTTLFTAHYSARFEHDFPAEMDMEILFANFSIKMTLNTTFRRPEASVNITFEVAEKGEKKLSTKLTSKVQLTDDALIFNDKTIYLSAYPLQMHFKSDQDFSNPEVENFIETFNKHTQIKISNLKGNLIGQVFLAQIQGRDRLNPMIRYADGETESLEDMLLIFQKILNMKIIILDKSARIKQAKSNSESRTPLMVSGIIE